MSKRDIWDLLSIQWCKNERNIMKHKGIDEITDEKNDGREKNRKK